MNVCQVLILYKIIQYFLLYPPFSLRDFPHCFQRVTDYLYEIIRAVHSRTHTREREEKGKADYRRRHAVTPPFVPFYPQRPTTSRDRPRDKREPQRERRIYRKILRYIGCLKRRISHCLSPISPPLPLTILTISPGTPCRWSMHCTHACHARYAREVCLQGGASRYRSSLTQNWSETAR